jgi:hypothetical protein
MARTKRLRLDTRAMAEECKQKTDAIEVGARYFLSSFYDKEGAWVKVLGKSHKVNRAGWPSTVEVEVEEFVAEANVAPSSHYAPGKVITVNASNLYANRADSSHRAQYPSFYRDEVKG